MALPSSFWLPLAGLLIVAPQPSSAASFFAFAGGYALTTSDTCASVGTATSATCDATNTSTDPVSGETKSGEIHVGADLASGDLFVHAESEASLPTAQVGGEAQIGDTLSFNGASSPTSTTTLTMTGTMSNSNGFTAGSLEIFDDTGLLTAGGACSKPTGDFICGSTNSQTKVTVVGNSFFVSSTVNIEVTQRYTGGVCCFCFVLFNQFRRHLRPDHDRLAPGRHLHLRLRSVSDWRGQCPRDFDMGDDAAWLRRPWLRRVSEDATSRP